jgi:hypothetical protein
MGQEFFLGSKGLMWRNNKYFVWVWVELVNLVDQTLVYTHFPIFSLAYNTAVATACGILLNWQASHNHIGTHIIHSHSFLIGTPCRERTLQSEQGWWIHNVQSLYALKLVMHETFLMLAEVSCLAIIRIPPTSWWWLYNNKQQTKTL